MTDPSIPLPAPGIAHSPALRLACPACSRDLVLDVAHVGVEGFCPECHVPIIARPGASGEIAVCRLDLPFIPEKTATEPLSPPPPLPSAGGTVLQTKSGIYVESRKLKRKPSPFVIGLITVVLVSAVLAAAAVSLRRSGRLFDFARPERLIPEPIPVASAPMAITSPGVAIVETAVVEEATPAPPAAPVATPQKPEDARGAVLAAAAEKTLRAFFAAERSWEKLVYVVEPEDDLLSILEFQELDPIPADAPVRELEFLHSDAENRWISLATVPEKDGSLRTFCLVHRNQDGAAKLDFSLYWQNRSDILRSFLEGEPKDKPLTVRAELRRLPSDGQSSALRFAVSQAYSSFAPVEILVSAASPVAKELIERGGIDAPSPAVVEIVWSTGEGQPQPAPTIRRVVQWGLWPHEG